MLLCYSVLMIDFNVGIDCKLLSVRNNVNSVNNVNNDMCHFEKITKKIRAPY